MTEQSKLPRKRCRPVKSVPAPTEYARKRSRPKASVATAKSTGMSFDGSEIGYGRPPVHSQFKKGQSGNPKGRPKGNKNFKTSVRELANRKVEVAENGKRRKMTTMEVTLRKLYDKTLNGDLTAMKKLLDLFAQYLNEDIVVEQQSNSAEDIKLLSQVLGLPIKRDGPNDQYEQA